VTWALRKGGVLAEALAAAAEADLVVLGARGTNPVRDFVLGTTPERLLARNASPTLVVRRSAVAPYRRALAAIAEPDTAPALLAAAEAIAPAAEVHALHATDLPFEGRLRIAGVGEDELRGYRRRSGDRALAAIQHAIAGLPAARSQQVLPVVATGNAIEALIEHQRASGVDLIIIGKRADGGLGDFLLGSTARHVLAGAGCDVLVIALPAARAH
jgi:nucleotide-binding universal stress UspA family protein